MPNKTTWLHDDKGNRCSVEHFGSVEKAQAALDSLVRCWCCTNCIDCMYCSYCTNCMYCSHCAHCIDRMCCSDCSGRSGCSKGSEHPKHVPLDVKNSDSVNLLLTALFGIFVGAALYFFAVIGGVFNG